MLWTPAEGVLLFDEHLARLGDSAGYFDFPFDRTAVVDAVAERVSGLPAAPHRLRLLWSRLGEAEVTASPEPRRSDAPVRLRLAPRPVDSRSRSAASTATAAKVPPRMSTTDEPARNGRSGSPVI